MGIGKLMDAAVVVSEPNAPRQKHSMMWLMHRGVDASVVPVSAPASKTKRRPTKKQSPAQDACKARSRQRRSGCVRKSVEAEVAELKRRIRDKVHRKFEYFDFLLLQRVTAVPVEIPAQLVQPGARSAVVAGKCVPFTRAMWNTQKRRVLARLPPRIDE